MVQPIPVLVALGGSDCERIGAGWLAQPVNTLSSLAYVAVGGWLLRRATTPGTDRVLLVTTGTAIAAVGLASAGYHGPQPAWAQPLHDGSIVGLALLFIGHTVWRLRRGRRRRAEAPAPGRRPWVTAGPSAAWAAVAVAAYALGRTGSPLCRPESLWQPHGAWHVLSAIALGTAVFAFARNG